ncbi:MAG: hypothetical protein M3P39_00810 [Actinomycetota bacterium]|nr:hypothetical protein [Actinomycetota bacterium]
MPTPPPVPRRLALVRVAQASRDDPSPVRRYHLVRLAGPPSAPAQPRRLPAARAARRVGG